MSNSNRDTRRKFLQQIGGTGLFFVASPLSGFASQQKAEERMILYNKEFSANDTNEFQEEEIKLVSNHFPDSIVKVFAAWKKNQIRFPVE